MPSTLDPQAKKGLFALFKGEKNTAKSGAALSFPKSYVFDFDRKMPSVSLKHFPDKEVHWDTFNDIFQVSDKLSEFLTVGCPYETLIVDSVTSLSTTCLNSIGMVKGEDVMKLLKTRTKAGTIEVMGVDYYNGESNFFERYFLDNLKVLWAREGNPKHVIVIAHVITTESAPDLKTKLVTKTRSILTAGRKVAAFIPTKFDEDYTFAFQLPELGDELTPAKRICITSGIAGEDSSRTAFNFPARIDFTNGSLYNKLNEIAKWEI